MRSHDADELSRARLAYVSLGQPSLTAPRRAAEPEEPEVVDEPAQPAAPRLPHHYVLAAAAVLVVLVVVLATTLVKSAPEMVPAAPVVASSAPVEPPASPVAEAPPSQAPDVRVHVLGGVTKPGVVTLDADAIVADAIEAAGGLAVDAEPGDLNLAAPVAPGMQVRVGIAGEASHVEGAASGEVTAQGDTGGGGKVNLNTATAGELETLPGVGPVMAQAIIGWRDEHGGFTTVTELQEISGIGPKTFAKLEPHVEI